MDSIEEKRQRLKSWLEIGWHEVENDGESVWVWSKATSKLKLPQEIESLVLQFHSIYFALTKREQHVKIFVDDKPGRSYKIKDRETTIQIDCENGTSIRVEADVVRPSEWTASQDSRQLGIAISRIVTIPQSSQYHLNSNLESLQSALYTDLPYDLEAVSRQFQTIGYGPTDFFIDIKRFREYTKDTDYSQHDYGNNLLEKRLEHFVSLSFCSLTADSKVIDIANNTSRFPEIVHHLYGCQMWSNDLIFAPGILQLNQWHTRVGGNACNLQLPDDFFDLATCHCAFEMFEGRSDTGLIKEVERILRPGGKCVILPLYMNKTYHIMRDPLSTRIPLPEVDPGAKLIYRHNFYGLGFTRIYNVAALKERVIDRLDRLHLKIYRVRNLDEVGADCYLHWIAVFEKKGVA